MKESFRETHQGMSCCRPPSTAGGPPLTVVSASAPRKCQHRPVPPPPRHKRRRAPANAREGAPEVRRHSEQAPSGTRHLRRPGCVEGGAGGAAGQSPLLRVALGRYPLREDAPWEVTSCQGFREERKHERVI